MVIVHATSGTGISLSLELNKSQRANHWTCYTMHSGVPNNNVGRVTSTFHPDDYVPSTYQVAHNEYTSGKYTSNATNLDGSNMTLFARGHICASEDRQTTEDQNYDTFITSNIHPQYQAHNAGLWQRMEAKVQSWGYSNNFRDTLYVCKGATIGNVVLNGSTVSGTIPKSEVLSKFGVNITGTLTIPRYWYMAVLRLKNGQYQAMAYWTEQINSSCSSTTLQSCMITIDELERRTGIDFFCNLPDDIEDEVEATLNTSIWQ
jgi:endonuclease G